MSRDHSGAAFVCTHVAAGRPVLVVIRDEPVEQADTGWQFLCGDDDEDEEPRIWSLAEVLASDPSLIPLASLPVGTALRRSALGLPWTSVD